MCKSDIKIIRVYEGTRTAKEVLADAIAYKVRRSSILCFQLWRKPEVMRLLMKQSVKALVPPATRAGIIEKLVRTGFTERRGDKKTKYLAPTIKGEMLISVIPEAIQSASMTAEWEQKLLRIEKEDYSSEEFMREICELIAELVATYEKYPVTFEKERKYSYGKKKKK